MLQSRRTKLVLEAVQALVKAGANGFAPADIGAHLRAHGEPMGAWEVRGELSNLEASGDVRLDTASARWHLNAPTE